ncbi:uncharacterized protein LOC126748058 [Anthonomus grandis grandis]|uniref:uncharacterized protein LOC126748058 n=1 Tax=Anthonomus grandis grandis TaxID=2921223 RepID=UPI0021651F09|nr:uncharacterized protein LOC126748058 [Anthonomus grandis grandis]
MGKGSRNRNRSVSGSDSRESALAFHDLDSRMKRIEQFILKTTRGNTKSRGRPKRSRSRSSDSCSEHPARPRRRDWISRSPDSSEQEPRTPIHPRKRYRRLDSSELDQPNHRSSKITEQVQVHSKTIDPEVDNREEILVIHPDKDTEQFLTLKDDILECLGTDPNDIISEGIELHPALVSRWSNIIKCGLDKQERLDLTKKYLVPKNLKTLEAPDLNEEILKILSQDTLKKDKYLAIIQSQLGASLAALGSSLNKILGQENNDQLKAIITELSDTGKLLTDLHHYVSISTRYVIIPSLDDSLRQVVVKTTPDSKLFGSDFADKIKTARDLEKNSRDLKATKSGLTRNPRRAVQEADHLNWRGPSRSSMKFRHQGQKPQQNVTYRHRPTRPARQKY